MVSGRGLSVHPSSIHTVQASLTLAVPAFVLGIMFGPAASNFMNVFDWDRDGVYHEVAYVRQITPDIWHMLMGSGYIAPYHWHSASQGRL